MRECRYCKKMFEPESFEVYCNPECAYEGNRSSQSRRPQEATAAAPQDETSEEEFQAMVIDVAGKLNWNHYHTRNSKGSKAGFTDLVMWRERVIFVELKKESGEPTAAQLTTMEELRAAAAEVYLWRPSNWEELVEVLK